MKKGFTLVELLAVIVILGIILAVAIPKIINIVENARESAYKSNEKMLRKAAHNYLAANNVAAPTDISHAIVIKLIDLASNNYINTIFDLKDKAVVCEGYVIVSLTSDSNLEYNPYLKCGSNYTTIWYNDDFLNDTKLLVADILVVAGGGSGGAGSNHNPGGGGGAGGYRFLNSYFVRASSSVDVVVGAGGNNSNGSNSLFGSLIASGGGKGGNSGTNGNNGGSGGGAGGFYIAQDMFGGIGNVPSISPNQGNNGGNGIFAGYRASGGGGGISEPGQTGTEFLGGNGGAGVANDITGGLVYYAGGGGGSIHGFQNGRGIGGIGGGGSGGIIGQNGENGTINTGGGGGGASGLAGLIGGSGGSGIVVVRYHGPQKATGGTITSVGAYTIHSFTTIGSFTLDVFNLN